MVIGAIEFGAREQVLKQAKYTLVADVHPKGYLRILAVAAEMSLSYEEAHHQTALEIGDLVFACVDHALIVSPS